MMKTTGIITTYAGSSSGSYGGDNTPADTAWLNYPYDVALDSTGTLLYIADRSNYRIRLVTKGTGSNIITTFAGNGQCCSVLGDGGAAISATLNYPSGVAVDSLGLVYIADTSNHRIRVVSKTGIITTIAGQSSSGNSGDNGLATSAYLWSPNGVTIDSTGTFLYIADTQNNRIRLVTIGTSSNIITTYAGNGNTGSSGDDAAATSAQLNSPRRVALDSSNNLYIADTNNNKVRLVLKGTSVITTLAGSGSGGYNSADGGPATSATLFNPSGIALDTFGNVFIADTNNYRVRVVVTQTLCSAGFYSGGASCLLCAAGTYTSSTSVASTCTLCPAGTSSAPGSTTCSYCTNGFYSPTPGLTACIACPTGFASSSGYGATACNNLCARGYSVDNTLSVPGGSVSCVICSPGYYTSVVGATACYTCGWDTYSTSGAVSCTPCPSGFTSSPGASVCGIPPTKSPSASPYVSYVYQPPVSYPYSSSTSPSVSPVYQPVSSPFCPTTSSPPTYSPTVSPSGSPFYPTISMSPISSPVYVTPSCSPTVSPSISPASGPPGYSSIPTRSPTSPPTLPPTAAIGPPTPSTPATTMVRYCPSDLI